MADSPVRQWLVEEALMERHLAFEAEQKAVELRRLSVADAERRVQERLRGGG